MQACSDLFADNPERLREILHPELKRPAFRPTGVFNHRPRKT